MRRIMLVVSYDGTNYCGWQIQPEALTVEKILNECLSSFLQEEIKVIGASRTDSGVHALGNVAVFNTASTIPGNRFSYALNKYLPQDIVIQESREVPIDFHPRHCNTRKTYVYKILNTEFPLPLKRYDTYFFPHRLDLQKMKEAASFLVGEHDFKSFCSIKTQSDTTVRNIFSIEVDKSEDIITIEVKGNGFLYNMIRIIAGTLIQAGTGKFTPHQVGQILQACDRSAAGPTAPPEGLTLMNIDFDVI